MENKDEILEYIQQKIKWFSETAQQNYKILHEFMFEDIAGSIYNYVIDYIGEYFDFTNEKEFVPKTAFEVMLVRLMSEDDWIWFDILAGDIFGAFRRLRFMLELLAIGIYLWDKEFFNEETIEEFRSKQNIKNILNTVADKLGIDKEELRKIYDELSNFVHYGKGEWERIIKIGIFPSQHIPLAPQTYSEDDIPLIEEFLVYYSKLADLTYMAIEKYKEYIATAGKNVK